MIPDPTIADLIVVLQRHRGEGNEISADELLATMRSRGHDIAGLPTLRALVHDARMQHEIICSNAKGYYMATCLEEAKAFAERLRDPSRDMMHTARVVRQSAVAKFGGQLRMM